MSKVLITGGAGLIGSCICKILVEKGHKPVVVDLFAQYISPLSESYVETRSSRFKDIIDKVVIERGDVSNYSTMYNIILKHKPTHIIHLAAIPLARLENTNVDDAMGETLLSTSRILEIINQLQNTRDLKKIKKFVYASSSMVYGEFRSDKVTEESSTNPVNIYGTMKLAGEFLTQGLCNTFEVPYNIIRPSAVYGPSDINKRVSQIFVENAIKGKELTVMGGEDEKLDFTFVSDIARGFILATFSQVSNEVFNITSGKSRSLLDFATVIKEIIPSTKIVIKERDSNVPKRGTLDISKAQKLLNYYPEYDLEKGIEEYIKVMKKDSTSL